jgi:hypothetical protein
LSKSKGIADATQDTLDALSGLFKEPEIVDESTLWRLYGPKVTHTRETMATAITQDLVLKCFATVAPLK